METIITKSGLMVVSSGYLDRSVINEMVKLERFEIEKQLPSNRAERRALYKKKKVKHA